MSLIPQKLISAVDVATWNGENTQEVFALATRILGDQIMEAVVAGIEPHIGLNLLSSEDPTMAVIRVELGSTLVYDPSLELRDTALFVLTPDLFVTYYYVD